MDVNTLLYRVIALLLGSQMMSFAWPLRGQFGGSAFLRFFAIAKTIVYSGWRPWETGFTILVFETLLLTVTMPFVLLGKENP